MKNISLLWALLLSCLWLQAAAQDRTITGHVTDGDPASKGQGLPGVTVLATGSPTTGTATNIDGNFSLTVPANITSLTFSYTGYSKIERAIGNGTRITITMNPDAKSIGEVVVVGALGIARQAQENGYATATLTTPELTQARPTNVVNGLTGKVSGLQIQTTNNGVNPTPRVTLRGNRSLTGNNEALIVIDGIITTNQVLGSLNPDDVASMTVLKGANAAALYGSQAANGAIIITTNHGKAGQSQVTFSHTSQFESISFLPKFQTEYGPGSPDWYASSAKAQAGIFFDPTNAPDAAYGYQYQGFENQQYGPRFDGTIRPFGFTLPDGTTQMLTYEARPNEKLKFFNTAYQTQNGVTFSGGDDKTKFYASYQNVHNNGIVPKDTYDRNSFRFNATREIGRLSVGFNINYVLRQSDVTTNSGQDNSVYWNVFNTSVMAPLTSYKDYIGNPYAESNYGYYNAYYYNPYFVIDYNRNRGRGSTLQGNVDLSYKVTKSFSIQGRLGTTNLDQENITVQNKFNLNTDSPKSIASYPGFYQDVTSYVRRTNADVFGNYDKSFGNFNVRAILGANFQQLNSGYNYVASTALAVPAPTDQINLANRLGNLDGGSARYLTRLYAFYADVTLGYKDIFYLHGSGRNDNISVLDASNRSFFYPGVDASFVFSNLFPALKQSSFFDYGKLRGGYTKTSLVNLGTSAGVGIAETGGAYRLNSTFSQGSGFPFGTTPGYSANNGLVRTGIQPEDTKAVEAGVELSFFKGRFTTAATYYKQNSNAQTLTSSISYASGYSSLLLNAGEVQNEGLEFDISITPIRLENGLRVTLGANFNYNENKVLSLPDGLPKLTIGNTGSQDATSIVAVPGQAFPVIQGTYYQRTNDGLIKLAPTVDPNSGVTKYYPLISTDTKYLGNTQPKYKYGFNFNIAYKGLTLAAQGELRTGYSVYNGIGNDLDFTGGGIRSTMYGRKDFVFPNSATADANGNYTANDGTKLTPGGSEFWANNASWNRSVSENYVTSGTFFKIREVSLSYVIPVAMASKVGLIKGASVNFFGRNVFTWVPKENIYTDPEFSGVTSGSNGIGINSFLQTPPTRFYGASLNITL